MMMARALLIAKQSRRPQHHRILFDRLLSTSTTSSSSGTVASPSSGSLVQWDLVKMPRSTTDEEQQQEQEDLIVGILSIGGGSGGANDDDGSGGTPEKGRPSYNPLTMEMSVELAHACRHPPDDNHLDAVIITGVDGSPAFSAGGHYEWLLSLRDQPVHVNVDTMLEFYHNVLTVRELPCPVLAALNGPAVGAGAGLALACDLRLAARTTTRLLGLTFTKLGVHTGMGAAHFLLSHAVPSGAMNEILLGGQTLSAEKCYEMGLVNRLVATPHEVRSGALDYIRDLLAHTHPVAVRTLMRTLRARQNVGLEEALQRDAYAQAVCYARRDWGEGVTAARDKRPAVFGPYGDK
jgi:enoyl-CoA hydratase